MLQQAFTSMSGKKQKTLAKKKEEDKEKTKMKTEELKDIIKMDFNCSQQEQKGGKLVNQKKGELGITQFEQQKENEQSFGDHETVTKYLTNIYRIRNKQGKEKDKLKKYSNK